MDVTAVVPFYGRVRHLERCVDSLLSQTIQPKVLVIDDCSPEPAPEFKSPLVQVHRTTANRGAFAARAVGLAVTTSEWTAVIDHDDWVEPDWIAAMADLNAPVVQLRHLIQQPQRGRPHIKTYKRADEPLGPLLGHRAPHVGLCRTDALRRVGGYSPAYRFGFDTLISAALRQHNKFAICEERSYHRLIRPDSLSHSERTGMGSDLRIRQREGLARLWFEMYGQSVHRTRHLIQGSAKPSQWRAVELEVSRLEG